MTPHRIDTHHHIYPPDYLAVAAEPVRRVTHAHFARIAKWTPQESIDAMDRAGIASAVISMSAPGIWLDDGAQAVALARACNDYSARLRTDHKGRFGVFASLPLPDIAASLREIAYACDELGVDGFGLMTNTGDKWPGDPTFAEVYYELNRRTAVVYFHPAAATAIDGILPDIPAPMIEFPHDTTRAIVSLLFSGTLARCPDIKFIFSHGGGTLPMLAGRIAGVAKNRPDLSAQVPNGVMHELRKLYYDIAGVSHPIAFRAALDLVGPSQLLFGTDYPFWPTELAVSGLATFGLDPAAVRAIERDNAAALLPRLA
jgi:predicted TIM-barrel fold metal-dependent hydrolase